MSLILRLFMLFVVMGMACALAAADGIGVLWYQKSGMAQRVYKSMVKELGEHAPDLNIEARIDLADAASALPIYQRFLHEKKAVVFLRSDGARYMVQRPPGIPGFFGAAYHPVSLGVVDDLEQPNGMLTGVSYFVPISKQFDMYEKLFPNLQAIGLLVKADHPSSPVEQADTRAECERRGIRYLDTVCADKRSLVRGVRQLLEEGAEVLILGNQNLLIDNGAVVSSLAGTTPVMSYSEKPITQRVALGGLVASDAKLGVMLAHSILAVVREGQPIGSIPVGLDPEPRLLIDPARAAKLGIVLSDEIISSMETVR